MYEIRLCRLDEKEIFKDFIRKYWSEDHIFVCNDDVLNFQHKEVSHYNFVVAYHLATSSFHGVLGFISPSYYANGCVQKRDDLWLALWKVEKSLAETDSLGLDLLEFLDSQYTPHSISAIGINDNVALLYKLLGFKIGTMRHWFILNDSNSSFAIANIHNPLPISETISESSVVSIRKIALGELDALRQTNGRSSVKGSLSYLKSRYLHHPTYTYEYYAITDNGQLLGDFVGRRIDANSTSCLRITDMHLFVDQKTSLRNAFQKCLVAEHLEYLDLLVFGDIGFHPEILGFSENDQNNYVPHLFEPFSSEKREVILAYRSNDPFSCFKGDSDLDRPNLATKVDE